MTVSSTRSPSPTPIRANHDPRTQRTQLIGVRKSFSGNQSESKPSIVPSRRSLDLTAPANSPSDFPRKVSGSLRASFEQKENEKDQNLKHLKVRSPSISKGSKHFMAPTVSAACKINPSPRRKILVERNVISRTSFSDLDGISSLVTDSDAPPETQIKSLSSLSKIIKDFVEKSSVSESDESSSLVIDSDPPQETQTKCCLPSVAAIIANSVERASISKSIGNSSVVVDSDEPPETQIKCVSSMTRIINGSEEAIDSKPDEIPDFHVGPSTENFSESLPETGISDSTSKNVDLMKSCSSSLTHDLAPLDNDLYAPPYDPKTNYLSPRPRFLRYKPKPRVEDYLNKEEFAPGGEGKRLEDSFTSECYSDTEVAEETQSSVSLKESDCVSYSSSDILSEEDEQPFVSESKSDLSICLSKSSSGSRVRSRIVPILLVLVAAFLFLPVIDSPIQAPSAISISYLSKLIVNPRVVEQMVFSRLSNLTGLGNELHDGYQRGAVSSSMETKQEHDQHYLELEKGGETDEVPKQEQKQQVQPEEEVELMVEELSQPPITQAPEVFSEDQLDLDSHMNTKPINVEVTAHSLESSSAESPEVAGLNGNLLCVETVAINDAAPQNAETQPANVEAAQSLESSAPESSDMGVGTVPVKATLHNLVANAPPQSSNLGDLNGSLFGLRSLEPEVQNLLTIFSVLAFLAATTGCFCQKFLMANAENSAQPKKMISKKSGDGDHPYQASPAWLTEEMVGESGPSLTSCSFKNLCDDGRGSERVSDVQSLERKLRYSKRESLAPSSSEYSGSPSYGSFTTFEKLHSKHACGEEEVVTPVRRSSRIRKQVVSPSG